MLVLCAPFTVKVTLVPSITTVCVICPVSFCTVTVTPAVLLNSIEQTRVAAMGGLDSG